MTTVAEIKRIVRSKKVIIGTERTLKKIRTGKVKKVLLSANCPESVKKDILRYQKISPFEVIPLQYQNDEMGNLCKKPFAVSVLAVQ